MQDKLWFEPFIWTDYRLAVLFAVIVPLVLLIWAFVQKNDAIQHLLTIYWRVSSLLAITVYLMIAALPLSFISALLARILIPISLWFWVDLNEEIDDQPRSPLKLIFTSWRWLMTVYCTLGAIASAAFVPCAISKARLSSRFCQVWFDPPLLFKQYFHANTTPKFLGFLAITALLIYVASLCYFVLIKLGKHGRSAMQQ